MEHRHSASLIKLGVIYHARSPNNLLLIHKHVNPTMFASDSWPGEVGMTNAHNVNHLAEIDLLHLPRAPHGGGA
jgi:hypothetical protein